MESPPPLWPRDQGYCAGSITSPRTVQSRKLIPFLCYISIFPVFTILLFPFYSHFSDTNNRATDELWYKRAVDQHSIEPDSFVFSVPFDSGYTDKADAPLVTATHAIFIDHRGHKAPAAVVGLQFQHDSLARHFINITSAVRLSNGVSFAAR